MWWLAAIGNSGAMTLYLWHIPPLLAMHLVFDYLGYPRFDPSAPGFFALVVVQLLIMAALVAVVFVTLRPLENNPLPLLGRRLRRDAGSPQRCSRRAAVRRRRGHAGIGRMGTQG